MLFSEVYKFVFIAVPKTATTSIEQHLINADPNIRRNKVIKPDGSEQILHKHTTAIQVAKLLGSRSADYKYFAVIRDPFASVRSKYVYYKSGRGFRRSKVKGAPTGLRMRVLFARLCPYVVWALFYPYSSTKKFVYDDKGNLIVTNLLDYAQLESDLSRMLDTIGAPLELGNLPRTNVNPALKSSLPIETWMANLIIRFKSADDIALYRKARCNRKIG